jgi:hypothetical protein
MNFRVIIALMMEAVRTSETSVNFNVTTRRYIPEDSKLHTRRRENLKSQTATNLQVLSKAGNSFSNSATQGLCSTVN